MQGNEPGVTEDVKLKFEQTFANYVPRPGFDIVLQLDLQEVNSQSGVFSDQISSCAVVFFTKPLNYKCALLRTLH